MDIKWELLQNHLKDVMRSVLEEMAPSLPKIADSGAISALTEIKFIIGNEELSDFDAIEEIVCVLEKHNIDCRGRHNF